MKEPQRVKIARSCRGRDRWDRGRGGPGNTPKKRRREEAQRGGWMESKVGSNSTTGLTSGGRGGGGRDPIKITLGQPRRAPPSARVSADAARALRALTVPGEKYGSRAANVTQDVIRGYDDVVNQKTWRGEAAHLLTHSRGSTYKRRRKRQRRGARWQFNGSQCETDIFTLNWQQYAPHPPSKMAPAACC